MIQSLSLAFSKGQIWTVECFRRVSETGIKNHRLVRFILSFRPQLTASRLPVDFDQTHCGRPINFSLLLISV